MTALIARYRTSVLVLSALAIVSPAHAVVEAKWPLATIYGISKAVVVGTVEKVNAETGDVDVLAKETLNGDGFAGPCRIAAAIPEIRPRVSVGQPVVIMLSKRDPKQAILHIGDTWVLADYDATKRVPFFIARGLKPDFPHIFPGTTQTLIAIIRELKETGKSPLIDKVDPKTFDDVNEIGKLPIAQPTAVAAGDFDGDKSPDLAVATAGGVQVFSLAGGMIGPSKATPPKDFPAKAAPADETGPALASAVVSEPNHEPFAIVVRAKGITREAIAGNGGDKAKAPATPFQQLTGDEAKVFFPAAGGDGIAAAVATAIELNGDGKHDIFVATEEAAVVLINRGYGAFFVVTKVKDVLAKDGKYPFPIDAGTKLTAVDLNGDHREELIAVTADGKVYVAK